MKPILPSGGLRALINLPLPHPPEELMSCLACRKRISNETLPMFETELHARIYLYDMILKGDISTIPDIVVDELKKSRLSCFALLLYFQWRIEATRSAGRTAIILFKDEYLSSMPAHTRQFVAEQVVHLLLDSPSKAFLATAVDSLAEMELTAQMGCIVRLSHLMADFDELHPQATISGLRDLAMNDTEAAGTAAYYLLARIYCELCLPYEEMDCYSGWMVGLARISKRSPAALAGSISRENDAMEQVIKEGAARWLYLRNASGAGIEVEQVVSEFKKAGYGDTFDSLGAERSRAGGYDCRLVSRDDASNEAHMKKLLSEVLTSSTRQNACIIVRDEPGGEAEKFPLVKEVSPENEIFRRLSDIVLSAGLTVLPEVVEEGLLQRRKWVVCIHPSKPMDAWAIGILPMDTEFSVVYSRAIAFDTKLASEKNQEWFQSTIRLLGQTFDAQMAVVVSDAVRSIADQMSTGMSSTLVYEL